MSLLDRLIQLAGLTLRDPQAGARALMAEPVPMAARTGGLLLVAVLSAAFASIQAGLQPDALDPIARFMLASPIQAAVIQWVLLALTVILIFRVGRAFGGTGSLPDALLIVVWMQVIMLGFQILQLAAFLILPSLAGIIGIASLVVFFWLMTTFIAELHGFQSRGAVFAGIIGVSIAVGLVLGVVIVSIVGPEVFLTNV